MKIVMRKRVGSTTFEVDPIEKPGMPKVGRGRTMKEALGDFLINYQDELGIKLELDTSAQRTEQRRRQRELGKR